MKLIKKIFKKFDIFGVPFSFTYKNEEKYTTSLGGLIFILFFIAFSFYEIYFFIPFFNRKNFSIIYYSNLLAKTEIIKLEESKSNFAIGLSCDVDKDDGTKAEDLFDFKSKYVIFEKKEGKERKTKENLFLHPCQYSDFYNNYNNQFDILGLKNLLCLDKTNHTIEGIYTDEIFSYYEFSVVIKEDNEDNFTKINDYLTRNDCLLQLYYTHSTFDLNNYKEPKKHYMNALYAQLDPISYIKKNIYFMNQYFDNDNYLFFVYDEKEPMKELLYSRTEEFSLYKGLDRGIKKPNDYEIYARFYIRADTQKIEIKRKYQKVMEFFADSSSLVEVVFYTLSFIVYFFNGFYAIHSIRKKIFFFKEIKNDSFDALKKYQQIKRLIDLTEPLAGQIKSTNYNFSKKVNVSNHIKIKDLEEPNQSEKESINISNLNSNILNRVEELPKLNNFLDKKVVIFKKKDIKEEKMYNNYSNNNIFNKFNLKNINQLKSEKLEYSYNIFEIIFSTFFCCCITRKTRLKNGLNIKANNILYNKLDVVLYIRNMLLFDVMKRIFLEDNTKYIFKFLSQPKLSINKNQEKENDVFYENYSDIDFNLFYDEISNLIQKNKTIKNEKKLLIRLSNKDLKKLL